MRDGGNLLTRAGLAIPAVDVDEVQVHYRDPVQLVEHLRCGGRWGQAQSRCLRSPGGKGQAPGC